MGSLQKVSARVRQLDCQLGIADDIGIPAKVSRLDRSYSVGNGRARRNLQPHDRLEAVAHGIRDNQTRPGLEGGLGPRD
jgi:hypothetical protein